MFLESWQSNLLECSNSNEWSNLPSIIVAVTTSESINVFPNPLKNAVGVKDGMDSALDKY